MFMSIVDHPSSDRRGVFVPGSSAPASTLPSPPLPLVSVLAITMLIAAAVTAASRQQLMNTGLLVFVAVVLHNALGMLFGFLVAKWSGMNLAKCKCMAFEVGMQNSGLGVALASVHCAANQMTALPAAIAALWHNVAGPMLATVFQNWRDDDEKASFFDRMEAACKTPAKAAAAE